MLFVQMKAGLMNVEWCLNTSWIPDSYFSLHRLTV